jgi:hypothetical protein
MILIRGYPGTSLGHSPVLPLPQYDWVVASLVTHGSPAVGRVRGRRDFWLCRASRMPRETGLLRPSSSLLLCCR